MLWLVATPTEAELCQAIAPREVLSCAVVCCAMVCHAVPCCAVLWCAGLALRCYRRAVAHGDREGIGIAKLVSVLGLQCGMLSEH
jgi:hypothetical protein